MSLKCMLQPNILMQMPFRFQGRHSEWYLGETGGVGYLLMLDFSFTFDSDVSLAQAKVE